MGVKLNRSALAEHMGVSLPTVDRWVKDGMPVVQRGARGIEWSFDLADIIRWYAQRQAEAAGGAVDDLAEIEKRTAKAKMEKVELELAIAKGAVAPVREFEIAHAKRMAIIRQSVLNVVGRSVMQLLGCRDEAEFRQKLRAELVLALEQSASGEIDVMEDDDEQADDEA
ncbi:putative small terminase subunit [Ralstonia phage phiRSP]|uniref:Putative small terminase subunit n=1 Tax=Ralstonia phage phiRSP TaxID=2201420 RepID=A0A345ANS7_9CAUD|nr:terminase small subunit [Ralstonia phage phiRSP]AXF38216.1 putative small terminase subunit [Ralstonia phage phiRSP]